MTLIRQSHQVRSDPYDNQIGEAEYSDRGLMGYELDGDHELIEIEEL